MAGGIIEFTEHTAVAFCFKFYNRSLKVDAVVILRSTCPIRELWLKNPESPPLIRPPGMRSGGGTTLVGHSIHFDRESKKVWIDNRQEVVVDAENVLLIDGAENYGQDLSIVGKVSLSMTDSEIELLSDGPIFDPLKIHKFLTKSLLKNPEIKEFCR